MYFVSSGLLLYNLVEKSETVKRTLLVFPFTTLIALGIVTSRQKDSDPAVPGKYPAISGDISSLNYMADLSVPTSVIITPTDEVWIPFKKNAEEKFRNCQKMISLKRANLLPEEQKNPSEYSKKIVILEARLSFEKARLEAFGKYKVNWDVFEPGFNREMDFLIRDINTLSDED
jgi:hypothetical protein